MKYGYNFCRLVLSLGLLALLGGCGSPEQNAQSHYESAVALIQKGEDVAARGELQKAAKYKSDKVEIWRALAGVDERTKAGDRAVFNSLRRVVELDPNDLVSRLKVVRLMLGGGATEAGLRMLDAANPGEDNSAKSEVHALRAQLLLRSNDGAGAVREAQQALELNRDNGEAIVLLAFSRISDKDLDGALKLLDSLPPGSNETRATQLRIEIFARKNDLPKAEQLLRTLIAQNPQEIAYQNQLIQLLIAEKKFAEAETEFRARIAAAPSDTKIGLDFVRFLIATKGAAAGKEQLEERIKAGGDDFEYKLALVELELAQNKPDEAIQSLQKLASTANKPDRVAAAQIRLAQVYLAKGDTTAADPLIADVLAKDRKNVAALRLRAARFIDTGQLDNAVSDLREAISEQPKSIDLLMLMATAYERSGKSELADRQYADAIKSSNSNPDVVLRYVAFLQRKSEAARAEEVLTEAASRTPSNIQILSSLGQVRLSKQNWQGALAIADTISRLNDGRVVADQIRAAALAGQNKVDESIAALEDARKAAPNAVQPVLTLASTYLKQGKANEAVALLKELSDKAPNSAQLLVFLGQAQIAQKKDQDALQSFKKAATAQPKEAAGYAALADFYIRNKDYASASEVLQSGLTELPGNMNFRLSLAGLNILKGDNDAAISDYELILKDQPNSIVAINNLVSLILDIRSDKQSIDRAIGLSEKLKTANLPQFQDTVGWAEYKKGDFNGAIATLEGVVAKAPSLAAARYHLAMSYAAAGQKGKAAEQLKSALSLEPGDGPLKESIKAALKEAQ